MLGSLTISVEILGGIVLGVIGVNIIFAITWVSMNGPEPSSNSYYALCLITGVLFYVRQTLSGHMIRLLSRKTSSATHPAVGLTLR